MTHDTPGGGDEKRLWCDTCEMSVVPVPERTGSTCPACGTELD